MARSGRTGFVAMNQAAAALVVFLLGVGLVGSVIVADDSSASFDYKPDTVTGVQTMSTEVHDSKTSQQEQQRKESEIGVATSSSDSSETTVKDPVKDETSEPVHTKFARTGSRTARKDGTSTSTSAGVTQEAQLNGYEESKPDNYPNFEFTKQSKQLSNAAEDEKSSKDVEPGDHPINSDSTDQSTGEKITSNAAEEEKSSQEVKPNNYPNFEFTRSTEKSKELSDVAASTTETESASHGAQEEQSTVEGEPITHPNFEFAQQSKVESKQMTDETASTEAKQSSNTAPEESKEVKFKQSKQRTDDAALTEPKQSTSNAVAQPEPKEVKPNNYPNFEFKPSKEESKQTTDEIPLTDEQSSTAAPEEDSKEVKPNNYPNFEFKQSKEESKQTTNEASSTEAKQSSSAVPEESKGVRPDNSESPDHSSSSSESISAGSRKLPFLDGYDEEEAKRFAAQFNPAPAKEQSKDNTYSHAESTSPVRKSEKTSSSSSSESQSSSTDSAFWSDMPSATFRGADSSGKYTSSFDLTNARNRGASSSATNYRGSDASGQYTSSFDFTNARRNQVSPSFSYRGSDASGRYPSSFDLTNSRRNQVSPSSTYRGSDPSGRYPSSFDLTNARYQTQMQQQQQQPSMSGQHATSFQPDTEILRNFQPDDGQQFFARNPSLPKSAYRFGDSSSSAAKTFGDSHFRTEDPVDQTVYSQFSNSPSSTINPAPAIATKATGCSSNYWSTHTENWPKFFTPSRSLITDAFGTRAGTAYGTTTMLQALTDGRVDAYSQLSKHGVAALLNAYTKPTSYQFSHTVVIDQFDHALVSRTAATVQAKVFENANNAYGTEECKV